MAVSSTITSIVSGGYGQMVKLDDDRIVSLAQHLKEVDAGGEDEIVAISRGAYPIMVELSDGSIVSLAEHILAKQDGGSETVVNIASAAYNDQILSGTDIGSLALKVKADEAGGGGSALAVEEGDTPTGTQI